MQLVDELSVVMWNRTGPFQDENCLLCTVLTSVVLYICQMIFIFCFTSV